MLRKLLSLAAALALSGCSFMGVKGDTRSCVVVWKVDKFNVPVPVVDGVPFPMTEAERKIIGNKFVDYYCPRSA